VVVAKCPSTFRLEHATRLLNSPNRLELKDPRSTAPHPDRIYVFSRGVLYRAVPTVAGRSYHGFPEHAKGVQELPFTQQQRLWAWARNQQIEQQVTQWLDRT
jgi:hypothetical protein